MVERAWIYTVVLPGLVYGAKLFLVRFKVISRKLTTSRLASIVIFRPLSLKILHRLFLILSIRWGVASNAPRPSSR